MQNAASKGKSMMARILIVILTLGVGIGIFIGLNSSNETKASSFKSSSNFKTQTSGVLVQEGLELERLTSYTYRPSYLDGMNDIAPNKTSNAQAPTFAPVPVQAPVTAPVAPAPQVPVYTAPTPPPVKATPPAPLQVATPTKAPTPIVTAPAKPVAITPTPAPKAPVAVAQTTPKVATPAIPATPTKPAPAKTTPTSTANAPLSNSNPSVVLTPPVNAPVINIVTEASAEAKAKEEAAQRAKAHEEIQREIAKYEAAQAKEQAKEAQTSDDTKEIKDNTTTIATAIATTATTTAAATTTTAAATATATAANTVANTNDKASAPAPKAKAPAQPDSIIASHFIDDIAVYFVQNYTPSTRKGNKGIVHASVGSINSYYGTELKALPKSGDKAYTRQFILNTLFVPKRFENLYNLYGDVFVENLIEVSAMQHGNRRGFDKDQQQQMLIDYANVLRLAGQSLQGIGTLPEYKSSLTRKQAAVKSLNDERRMFMEIQARYEEARLRNNENVKETLREDLFKCAKRIEDAQVNLRNIELSIVSQIKKNKVAMLDDTSLLFLFEWVGRRNQTHAQQVAKELGLMAVKLSNDMQSKAKLIGVK